MSRASITLVAILAGGLAVAGCARQAPAPEPVRAEPVFNKFGASCRPEREPISTVFPARLPICEDLCRAPQQAGTAPVICPPQLQRFDDDDDGGTGTVTPTGTAVP